MNAQDAQTALHDIRRLQDKTRDELARQLFSLPYMALMAVGLFIGYASSDLPGSWDDVAVVLGFGLFIGVVVVQHLRMCRASVRPRFLWVPERLELVFYLSWAASPLVFFLVARWVAEALGLPATDTLAAAVTALAYVAATPLFRGIVKSIMQRQDGRG
ncbi:hypothetical protein [Sphaerisporangium corydalis]|uniref:Uncharacterized protein n=1 Tax=Sphaerisporangium corydalis TaxID=1441875 RepID=A0ABV9EF73_9ACTN|nr:hypothetical protein [Sphaerisporangium corydalis]